MGKRIMRTLVAILAVCALVGCSSEPKSEVTPGVVQTPTAGTKDATSADNVVNSNAKTVDHPIDSAGGGYRIEPSDPKKFPSNAANGAGGG